MSKFEGQKAAKFKLKDQYGKERSLEEFKGSYILLYFYPKDLTPGCTTEACNFQSNLKKLSKLNTKVIGLSADDIEKHQQFANKYSLEFTLLADTDKELITHYELWTEKSMYGKKYMGIQRDSFLIGPDGKIIKHYVKVKPDKHVDEVLEDLQLIQKG